MLTREFHAHAWPFRGSGDLFSGPPPTQLHEALFIFRSHTANKINVALSNYWTVLPSLRMIFSPAYFTPLPL
jgi:hypothetical protein